MDHAGTPEVGDLCRTTRHIGGANRAATSRVTHIDPPYSWGVRGTDGPIRAAGISGSAATAVWQRFQNSPRRERWSRSWSLYILQKWCEVNEVAA